MNEEKVLMKASLVFPVRPGEVLLARKIAKIGAGKWNGYGGGIEQFETPRIAACRELKEESGVIVTPTDLEAVAIMKFFNHPVNKPPFCCEVFVYLSSIWHGEFRESDEMVTPTWFPIESLPISEMMPADPFWVPEVLKGHRGEGRVDYGPRQERLLSAVQFFTRDTPLDF